MRKLLLFDFDGVITNTLDMILGIQKELNQEITKEDYIALYYGNIFKNIEKSQNKKYTKQDQNRFFNLYSPRLLDLPPIEGITRLISDLQEEYALVIISSTINEPIKEYLRKHEILHCFKDIFGADVHKSKVEKIEMALEKYGRKPQDSIYITDTLGDIKEARKVGVDSVAVTWGFHDQSVLLDGKPRYIANSVNNLKECIDEFSHN